MAIPQQVENSRVISITANKKFRRFNLVYAAAPEPADFEVSLEESICVNCGFGSDTRNKWYPVMSSTGCPICGSKKKKIATI